jgi:hypothetical protein
MKKEAIALALLFCMRQQMLAQDSVSISDFRYPETRAIDWKGSLNGNFGSNSTRVEVGAVQTSPRPGSGEDLRLNLGSTFLFFHSKDNHDNQLKFSGNFEFSDHDRKQDEIIGNLPNTSETRHDYKQGSASVDWTYLHYLSENAIHIFSLYSLDYSGYYDRTLQSYGGRNPYVSEQTDRDMNFGEEGLIGFGYGRLRDGSFVFRALRIIERLQEDSLLKLNLTRDQTLRLIDRVSHTREYTTNFERWEKYLARDIVDLLAAMGLFDPRFMSAFSALRVSESFHEEIQPRLFGWRVYYGIGGLHTRRLSRFNEYITEDNNDLGFIDRFGAQYGRPLSLWTHWYSELTIERPPFKSDINFTINFSSTITYQVAERVSVEGALVFTRSTYYPFSPNEAYYRNIFSHVLGSFDYFIEDNFRFQLQGSFDHEIQDNYPGIYLRVPSSTIDNSISFSFGLIFNII